MERFNCRHKNDIQFSEQFRQKLPSQKTRNGISHNQNFKVFWGSMPPNPLTACTLCTCMFHQWLRNIPILRSQNIGLLLLLGNRHFIVEKLTECTSKMTSLWDNVTNAYVVVNFLSHVIFVFLLFLVMLMSANEVETKEKQKLPEIKNKLQHIHQM